MHTHETKTTYLDLFFSANVDAIDVDNAFVLASSMWFTAEFQILVVVALFKLPELGVHWFCESRLAQHKKLHKRDASESNIFCCPNCDYRTICKRYMADHTKLKHIQSGNGQFICTQGSCFQKPTIYPNQAILNKHRTCHQRQACKVCGKNVESLRSLKRHGKSKHKKEPVDKSKGKENANGEKIRQNPLACMALKTSKLKRFSSLPKGWSPITPDASHDPLDLGFLASPSNSSWDAEYSEVLRNALFVLK